MRSDETFAWILIMVFWSGLALSGVVAEGQSVTNLALNKPASQSSNHQASNKANMAVDGNTNGESRGSRTKSNNHAWLEIDLQKIYYIEDIRLWNSSSSSTQNLLRDYYVLISDDPFVSKNLQETLNQANVYSDFFDSKAMRPTVVRIHRTGRYVRIQRNVKGSLRITELEVMGRDQSVLPIINFTASLAPPTTNADGTPLIDLAGYRFYICDQPITKNNRNVSCVGHLEMIEIDDLSKTEIVFTQQPRDVQGQYYVRATAYDFSGNESDLSNEEIHAYRIIMPTPPTISPTKLNLSENQYVTCTGTLEIVELNEAICRP